MREERVWEGSPSQVVNLWVFISCGLTCFLVAPLVYALWRWLAVRCTRYEVTTERVRVTSGILSKRLEEIELYRVKDTTLVEPFVLRLFSLGTIEVISSDVTQPIFELEAISGAAELRELLRTHVEARRRRRRVRELDVVDVADAVWLQ